MEFLESLINNVFSLIPTASLVEKFPILSTIALLIGGFVVVVNPLVDAARSYVKYTKSEEDDKKLEDFLNSSVVKVIVVVGKKFYSVFKKEDTTPKA